VAFLAARFARDDLSEAARDVVETARTAGYGESHPDSPGNWQVLRRLHERAYRDGDVQKDAGIDDDGRRLLRYEGVYDDYWLCFGSVRRERAG
jgi:hypothetical protein